MKRRRLTLILLSVLVVAGGILWLLPPREPIYQTCPLSYWLYAELQNFGDVERFPKSMETLAAHPDQSLTWLIWAAEHGHQPNKTPTKFTKLTTWLSELFARKPLIGNNVDERVNALRFLRTLRPPPARAVPALIRLLQNEDKEIAELAADSLIPHRPAIYSQIIAISRSGSPQARVAALTALGALQKAYYQPFTANGVRLGYPEWFGVPIPLPTEGEFSPVMATLVEAFQDPDIAIRSAAVRSFVSWHSWDPTPKRDGIFFLESPPSAPVQAGKSPSFDAAIPKVFPFANDPEVGTDVRSFLHACRNQSPQALSKLLECLRDPSPQVRKHAMLLLGREENDIRTYQTLLTEMTHDPDLECRVTAARLLGKVGIRADSVISELALSLSNLTTSPTPRNLNPLHLLIEMGPIAIDALPAMVKPFATSADQRHSMFEFYGWDDDVLIPPLVRVLSHSDPNVRLGAISVLTHRLANWRGSSNEATLQALKIAAEDADPDVKAMATKALIGHSEEAAAVK